MYASAELTRLAERKRRLRRRIATQRADCMEEARRAARPLRWLDRAVATWRRIGPMAKFAAVPLVWGLERAVFSRRSRLGKVLRWGSIAAGALRRFARTR